MQSERQFIAPMSAVEAAQRAQYVLGKWKFKFWSIPSGIRFERSFQLAGMFVFHPHQVHCIIDILLRELPDGTCQIHVKQKVFKYGQPSANLDKMVWLGDMDDLEAALTRREEPKIDRVRQNAYAGAVSIKYVLGAVLPPLLGAGYLAATGSPLGALFLLFLIVVAAIILPYLPFKMPHFPLENQVPSPPFSSNYPRGHHQS